MQTKPATILRRNRAGRLYPHVRLEGRLVPVISGGDGDDNTDTVVPVEELLTVDEVLLERSRVLDSLDDIVRTAREDGDRELTADELSESAELEERAEALEDRLATVRRSAESAEFIARHQRRRHRAVPVPMVNTITTAPPSADRSLDELLWASVDQVGAGTITRNGMFLPDAYGAVNPVELVIVRNENDEYAPAPRIDDFLPEHHRTIRRFQQIVADMQIVGLMLERNGNKGVRDVWEMARSLPQFADRYRDVLRALDVDTSGEGGAWVPTGIGASIHEKVRASGKVAPLFMKFDMPTETWKWPLEGADATAYRVAEPTGDAASKVTASTPGTGAATFDAEILGGRILFSKTIEAASIVAVLPHLRFKLARAFVEAEETAIINGDTDGNHQDSDVGASTTDARTLWDGLRKKGLAQTVHNGADAALSSTVLRAGRAAMGKWGINPAELAHIVGVTSYHRLLADSNLVTVDKFGPNAVLLNGQVGAVDGIPIIVSEHVREDLTANAVYDGVTTTQTFSVTVNRGEWALGQRAPLSLEVDDSIYRESYQRVLVGFMREDFQHIGDAATNDDTLVIRNLDLDAD